MAKKSPYILGTVRWFNPKMGYGFITSQKGENLFIHFNDIQMDGYKKLLPGQNVQFVQTHIGQYLQAKKVTLHV